MKITLVNINLLMSYVLAFLKTLGANKLSEQINEFHFTKSIELH